MSQFVAWIQLYDWKSESVSFDASTESTEVII